jgi:hypothetical protein
MPSENNVSGKFEKVIAFMGKFRVFKQIYQYITHMATCINNRKGYRLCIS